MLDNMQVHHTFVGKHVSHVRCYGRIGCKFTRSNMHLGGRDLGGILPLRDEIAFSEGHGS